LNKKNLKTNKLQSRGFKSLTAVSEVINLINSRIRTINTEIIKTEDSFGRIVAQDIKSPVNIPHFSRSAMDGYAVKAEDTFGASIKNPKKLKIVGKIKINEVFDGELSKGKAVQIPTGGPIPTGADAVIKVEDTKRINDEIKIYKALTPFKNVSKIGEDVKKGDLIIEKGTTIRPQEITILLACNILKVNVYRKPKVAIITSGSELIEKGMKPEIGQIIETNSYSCASLCRIYGGEPIRLGIVKDNKESLIKILEKALEYDLIVFTGGSSVGEDDLIPEIVQTHPENEFFIHGIAMRPGSPTAIGFIKNKPVFCLPGFPVATMISFETFVGYTIRKMMNAKNLDPRPVIIARLTRQIPSQLGRRDFVRVRLRFDHNNNEYIAEPIRSSGSGIISSMVRASGILEIPEDLEGLEKDNKVIVKLFIPR